MTKLSIFIGYDPRPAEIQAYAVARTSIERRLSSILPIRPIILSKMRRDGLYTRPTEKRNGRLWDVISGAPMSTEFAISRFLTPTLAREGFALFMDADMLVRTNIHKLFSEIDRTKAVSVVQHNYDPGNGVKMDNQIQTSYGRKNWSSVMVFNCDHPSVKALSLDVVNEAKGLWLHQFGWLRDDEIGALDPKWNYLVGHSDPSIDPAIVHFTDGTPTMEGYENSEYASEWHEMLECWA